MAVSNTTSTNSTDTNNSSTSSSTMTNMSAKKNTTDTTTTIPKGVIGVDSAHPYGFPPDGWYMGSIMYTYYFYTPGYRHEWHNITYYLDENNNYIGPNYSSYDSVLTGHIYLANANYLNPLNYKSYYQSE